MSTIKWLPLESNPDVMNKCLINLGVPEKWGVTDILSMDEEFLHMTPLPSLAVLLLFPISPKYIEYCEQQEERMRNTKPDLTKIYYMKQTIRNACGTIALVHAFANNEGVLGLSQDSVLKKFLDSTRNLSPEEKGEFLEKNMEISAVHEESAQQGQTEAPDIDDDCNQHYIAITNVDGNLVELDGRKSSPIIHGKTNEDSFLRDALRICKEYMERDPENLNFSAMSFGAMN